MSTHGFYFTTINLYFWAFTLFICIPYTSVAQDNSNTTQDKYSVEIQWTKPNYLHDNNLSKAAYRNDFFVFEGILYLNYIDYDKYELHRVDASTGESLGDIDIELNVEHTPTAASFVGMDSAGHPYLVALSTLEFDGYPLELYVLDISASKVMVNSKFQLPLLGTLWPRDVVVEGDITAGTFTATATAWPGQEPVKWIQNEAFYEGALMKWTVADGEASKPMVIRGKYTDCTLIACNDDKYLVYDRGFYDKIEDFDFKIPTLISINEDKTVTVLCEYDGQMENAFGAGAAVAVAGGTSIMLYGTGYQPATYALTALPDFPASLNAGELIFNFTEGLLSQGTERKNALAAPNKGQVVHSAKVDDNTVRFYTMTDNNSLACIEVKATDSGSIDILQAAEDLPSEYFNLNGQRVSEPLSPGFYLHRAGAAVIKKQIQY